MLLAGLFIIAVLVDQPVAFKDNNLELAIRQELGHYGKPIYKSQLLGFVELDLSRKDIQNIEDIENFRNLEVLNLRNNNLTDVSPLESLTSLRILDLGYNQLSDLSPLANLTNLKELSLIENNIMTLDDFENLASLEKLNLRNNKLVDISAISGLVNLNYLNLHSNSTLQDVTPIGNLVNLETLILRNVPIGDQTTIFENMTQLQQLNIRNTMIEDVSILGHLMSLGALQDNQDADSVAIINLLEVNPNSSENDPYFNLRPYWDNITYRFPINLPYYESQIKPPLFSHQSGFYENNFTLTLSNDKLGGEIYYTLDGSEPSQLNLSANDSTTHIYTHPINIQNRSEEPNQLSIIHTGHPTRDYHAPPSEVNKATVVRAMVLGEDGHKSNVITHTYFLGEYFHNRYTLPVIAIATNAEYLFDDAKGIYVPGALFEVNPRHAGVFDHANYTQRGLMWERPAFFQMLDPDGSIAISQGIGIRIHGGATRSFPQKSLRIYATEEYNEYGVIQYEFFPALNHRLSEIEVDTFTTLILRNAGNDWSRAMFRDNLAQSLLEHTRLDIQGFQPAIVFINGEYWGIHNVRTRYDPHYFSTYYGIHPEDLVILEGPTNNLYWGNQSDKTHYQDMLELIDQDYLANGYPTVNTLSEQLKYHEIVDAMDIDNFITYYVSQIYFNNTDWPVSNTRFWRKKVDQKNNFIGTNYGHDGKWRWMVFDVDYAFLNPEHDTLAYATLDELAATFLIRALLENNDFKQQFINTFADRLNTTFREDVVLERIDEFETHYRPEIEEHIHRWSNLGGSYGAWLAYVDEIREFALLRPAYQRDHILDYFNLPGTASVTVQTEPEKGFVQINTINIRDGAIGITDPGNWSGIYFQSVPIVVTAHPYPGYRFSHWEGVGIDNLEDETITIVPMGDIQLMPIYHKTASE